MPVPEGNAARSPAFIRKSSPSIQASTSPETTKANSSSLDSAWGQEERVPGSRRIRWRPTWRRPAVRPMAREGAICSSLLG